MCVDIHQSAQVLTAPSINSPNTHFLFSQRNNCLSNSQLRLLVCLLWVFVTKLRLFAKSSLDCATVSAFIVELGPNAVANEWFGCVLLWQWLCIICLSVIFSNGINVCGPVWMLMYCLNIATNLFVQCNFNY